MWHRSRAKVLLVLGAVVLSGSAALMWWLVAGRSSRAPTVKVQGADNSEALAAVSCSGRRRLVIEASSKVQLAAAQSGTAQNFEGTWRLTVEEINLAVAGGESLRQYSLLDASSDSSGAGRNPGFSPHLRQIYARYDGLGTLSNFYISKDASATLAEYDPLKFALMPWQLVRDHHDLYEVVEPDVLGLVVYRYKNKGDNIEKSKVSVPQLWQGNVRPRLAASTGSVKLGADGLVASIVYKEESETETMVAELRSTTNWKATVVAHEDRPKEAQQACLQSKPSEIVTQLGLVEIGLEPKGVPTRAAQGRTPEIDKFTVAQRIKQLAPVTETHKRQSELGLLEDHLELEPDKIALVEQAVFDNLNNPDDAHSFIGVLAGVDNQLAQAALLRIMKGLSAQGQDELLVFAMRQHLFSKKPAAENIAYMLDVAKASQDIDKLKLPAVLAATSAGSKLGVSERGELIKRLETEFAVAAGDELEIPMLAAWGNLGDRRIFSKLLGRAMGQDEAVANEAIEAMSQVPGEDVDRFLLSIASANAKSVTQRKVALAALSQRRLSLKTTNALIELYPTISDSKLRLAALGAIMFEENRHWPRARSLRCELLRQPGLPEAEKNLLEGDPC